MFDEKPENAECVEAIYAIAVKLKRGEILTHESIKGVLGIQPHEGPWDNIVNRVRRRLEREKGIATWPEPTVGYKLLSTTEQVTMLPLLRSKKAFRQLRRASKSVKALPDAGLSNHMRRAKMFAADRLKESEKSLRREIKAQKRQAQPTATIPRRPLMQPAARADA